MAVQLDFLEPNPFARNLANEKYLYKDLNLDLTLGYNTLPELLSPANYIDAEVLYDANSVFQSLYNIFNTVPGQKFLNPEFGLDLRGFVFTRVNERIGYLLGLELTQQIPTMEPRVVVDNINVTVIPDELTYVINIYFRIPSLIKVPDKSFNISVKFNSNGFTIL